MNKFKNPMIAAAVLAGLGLIGSLMNSHPSVQAATLLPPINVAIDPATLPLPVTGSTTVTGTVAATQSGPWNVGIANSAANPLLVRDVDGPNRQPFQRIFGVAPGQPGCGDNFCTFSLGTVPPGKFLVLTHFQGELALATGNVPNTVRLLKTGFQIFDVPRNSLACYTDGLSITLTTRCPFNEEIRVIVNAGEQSFIDTDTIGSYAAGSPQSFVVNGYYVDTPPSAPPLLRQMTEISEDQQSVGFSRRTVRPSAHQ
jgi:hypothetical protein